MLRQNQDHAAIITDVKGQLNAVKKEIETDVGAAKEKLIQHRVAIEGPLCASFVAGVRGNALERYRYIKADIYQTVIGTLICEGEIHGLRTLQELAEKRTALEGERWEAGADKTQVEKNFENLCDYDKFMLYGESDEKRTHEDHKKNASIKSGNDVRQAQETYLRRRNFGYALGVITTILFAAMDFSIIYSVFLTSNMGFESAFLSAFIAAVALDAPPYILGVVWTAKGDQQQLKELQGGLNSNAAKIELRRFNVVIAVLCVVISLFFASYLLVRVFLFLGGGDFDLALHFLVNREFHFENVSFSSADFISTFVPFVTSAMTFALGLLTSTSYTKYVKKMIVIINNDLQSQIKQYEQKVIEKDGEIRDLDSEINTKKREIWTWYFHDLPFPDDDYVFQQEVATKFQELSLKRYVGTYKTCCCLLREAAEAALPRINQDLAPYVAAIMQQTLNTMPISGKENDTLDEFWVKGDEISQRETTAAQINEIKTMVQKLVEATTAGTN